MHKTLAMTGGNIKGKWWGWGGELSGEGRVGGILHGLSCQDKVFQVWTWVRCQISKKMGGFLHHHHHYPPKHLRYEELWLTENRKTRSGHVWCPWLVGKTLLSSRGHRERLRLLEGESELMKGGFRSTL